MRRRALFSGSSLARTLLCPPSAVLPRIQRVSDRADGGSAIHEHLAQRALYGVSAATELLDEVLARWQLGEREAGIARARCMSFEWCPPRGAVPEIGLCLFDDGTVQRVVGGRGEYPDLPETALFPATIDLMWSEPAPLLFDPEGKRAPRCPPGATLWAIDYKTGSEAHVEPASTNPQALSAALLAAR